MRNETIRSTVRTMYDMQKLRIQCGNRITAAFRIKLGLQSSEAEEESDEAKKMLDQLRAEYKRITDGVKRITKNIKIDSPLITTPGEIELIEGYELLLKAENKHERLLLEELEKMPIFTQFLNPIKGIGPMMAGVICSEIDIHKCNTVSSLWRYAGLDVVLIGKDGEAVEEGRSRKSHHLTAKTYTNSDGAQAETKGITFNPFLKTKLIGVLGPSFLRAQSPYAAIYYNYKNRLENHPKHASKTKAHRANMATRYMIKEFLADLYTHWRTLESLPVRPRYNEEKLGITHSAIKKAA